MRRVLGFLFAICSLASAAVSMSYFRAAVSAGETRLFGLVYAFLAVGLGVFSLALLLAPVSLRRDTSFKSLVLVAVFIAIGVTVKGCSR